MHVEVAVDAKNNRLIRTRSENALKTEQLLLY